VHTLLSADVIKGDDGKAVRKWFKRWLGESLSARWPLPDGAHWFAAGGSVKWVWTRDYLDNVFNYVKRQRTTQ
jgi:hypothetical protein